MITVLVPRQSVDKPAIVLELKFNQSVETAIDQIKQRNYSDALRGYEGDIVLVGINYGKDKGHTCKIERISYKISDKSDRNFR